MATRSVARVVDAAHTLEGAGFSVQRPFPTRSLDHLDPFLLLDEMGPMELGPDQAKGAPDHPHRGFETVTYLLSGEMQHKDSVGHAGKLSPGDVQWMTAGAGVVHSEMPQPEFARRGGRMHGFQLWVNLPAQDKMMKPRYQDVPAAKIPEARSVDGKVKVRVIAGEALGAHAVIDTRIPIVYLHFTLQPSGRVVQAIPKGHNAFAYVIDGEGLFGSDERVGKDAQMLIFGDDGDDVSFSASSNGPLELLLLAGAPIGEPVARYGPFVMNTRQEIHEAIADFQSGRMGRIDF
jgi:redox-sensitive bicupin YhaK (pirin superfamily)